MLRSAPLGVSLSLSFTRAQKALTEDKTRALGARFSKRDAKRTLFENTLSALSRIVSVCLSLRLALRWRLWRPSGCGPTSAHRARERWCHRRRRRTAGAAAACWWRASSAEFRSRKRSNGCTPRARTQRRPRSPSAKRGPTPRMLFVDELRARGHARRQHARALLLQIG